MLCHIFCFFFVGAKHYSKQYQLCLGGFVIFSMKSARLEPTTSLSVLAARRDTYLRHEGWRPLQNLAGF